MSTWRALALSAESYLMWDSIGSVFWFLMDGSWMWSAPRVAYVLIAPAVLCHLLAIFATRKDKTELLVGLAVFAWLLMNVFWMVSDLQKDPALLPVAKACFIAGGLLILVVLKTHASSMLRFRRFRLGGD